MSEPPVELPIVLTATVIPNVTGGAAANPEMRLAEYRQVLQFCQQFAPVIFLENSGYPLARHPEFTETPRLRVRQFAPSKNPERGKGYQEFEMLDAWLAAEPSPPARWLKITGRYQVLNLAAILAEGRVQKSPMIIDQVARSRSARTYLFCTDTEFYQRQMRGKFQQCDDRTGEFIEKVLFREFQKTLSPEVCSFKTQPRISAVAGTSGANFPTGIFQWRVKQSLRWLNRLADKRRLWYSR